MYVLEDMHAMFHCLLRICMYRICICKHEHKYVHKRDCLYASTVYTYVYMLRMHVVSLACPRFSTFLNHLTLR